MNTQRRVVHSDFIFHVTKNELPFPEYKGSMTLTFSNKQDGIVRVEDDGIENSQLFLGTRPPNNGYVDQLEWKIGLVSLDSRHVSVNDPTYKFLESLAGSWFGVRSETTRSGEIKARYGKILGPIRFEVRDGDLPLVNFTYYFAPDYNPQVEWNGTSLVPYADLQGLKRY